ncbi:hypothetical protein SAMN04488598_14114 [Halanaerobium congolense]|jgi:hypothetical protein|uniref:Uncharacterized protein n=1 Tax=Halanaerobium congolense TaxID=54121 RepID=A0A1M7I8T2_9FIRM|nr:hypothetical protein C7953_1344 [Halanaerobium congolense]TDX47855.1 hypothetical protein C7954_10214 [Halanaerobium congolense]SDG05362.1 hypothetical protein SAMN04488598_14114 [Halanaerobium congolense]SDH83801.1 hypothetical protein SAMN04515651_1344 [Halanaerobium congolense]SDK50746.1 hypothetical protein SAMN04515655_10525 [Halanaerobium congolense]
MNQIKMKKKIMFMFNNMIRLDDLNKSTAEKRF